eukprot:8745361-Pyramimonas_sp.AAC.2
MSRNSSHSLSALRAAEQTVAFSSPLSNRRGSTTSLITHASIIQAIVCGDIGALHKSIAGGILFQRDEVRVFNPWILPETTAVDTMLDGTEKQKTSKVNPQNGETLIHHAAKSGQADAIIFLLNQGVQADITSNCGQTPLHYAAKHGHVAAADALCSQLDSVDIDAQDEVRFRLMWSRQDTVSR